MSNIDFTNVSKFNADYTIDSITGFLTITFTNYSDNAPIGSITMDNTNHKALLDALAMAASERARFLEIGEVPTTSNKYHLTYVSHTQHAEVSFL